MSTQSVKPNYDLVVIGAGAAGLTSAFTARGLGKSVLLVDAERPGGECTWSGCMPSKALINQAKQVKAARHFASLRLDGARVMQQVRQVSEQVYSHETPEVIRSRGVDYIQAKAEFLAADLLQLAGQQVRAKKVMLCTGSQPWVPDLPGLDSVPYLTNETLFQLTDLPDSMLILGAGVIGVEMAQALNRLGVEVHLLDLQAELLPREEPELVAQLQLRLQEEGVKLYLSAQVQGMRPLPGGRVELMVQQGTQSLALQGERLLLALGRRPRVAGMGLEALGLLSDGRLQVNDYLQTTQANIYAAGDVIGPYQLSHMANYQAKRAVFNAFFPWPLRRKLDYQHVCWAIFTDPELAHAGLTEAEARKRHGDQIQVYHYDLAKLDRAMTKAGDGGLIKLILHPNGRILGAHILAERGGDLIAQVQSLKTLGIKFSRLQAVIHPYPSYADAWRQLSQQVLLARLQQQPLVRWFNALRKPKA